VINKNLKNTFQWHKSYQTFVALQVLVPL